MKFLSFVTIPATKVAEVSAVSDKVMGNPPPGYQALANYACLAAPFDGIPPNSIVSPSPLVRLTPQRHWLLSNTHSCSLAQPSTESP